MTVKPLTAEERNATGNFNIKPHPDGKPWTKCCGTKDDKPMTMAGPNYNIHNLIVNETAPPSQGCMCFVRARSTGESRYETQKKQGNIWIDNLEKNDGRFFCCHRSTNDGYHRECAGWAATHHKSTTEKSNEDNS